ncbi:hypothetical protein G6F32_015991 [Rhizopus arrhizus]|nr:hypothetical protein G6F32_015991 [Rhizopus arrhizus]
MPASGRHYLSLEARAVRAAPPPVAPAAGRRARLVRSDSPLPRRRCAGCRPDRSNYRRGRTPGCRRSGR